MESNLSKPCSNWRISLSAYKAFFYALLSGLFLSMNSVLVHFARGTPAVQMSLYRFIGMLVFNLPIAVYNRANLIGPKGSRKMILYRAIAAVFTIICSFISFRFLPIGEATVIVHSTPVFATIFARVLLKEVCGLVQSVIVALTIIGIILIVNPAMFLLGSQQIAEHTIGVVFGLAGLFFQCSMVILTRLTRNVHYSVVCFTSSAVGTIFCFLLAGSAYNLALPRCGSMRWVAVAMGVSSSLGQILYVRAFQLENVGPITTLKAASDIIIAIVWQIGIFHQSLDDFEIAGTCLVVISVFLIGIRKWVFMLPNDSSLKQTLRFLTY